MPCPTGEYTVTIARSTARSVLLLFSMSALLMPACSTGREEAGGRNEAIETFCSNVSAGMRVKLYALKSLRKRQAVGADEAIGILERSVYNDRLSLENFHSEEACRTKNIQSLIDEANQYLLEHAPQW
jgi:hypothetical protein